MLIDALYTLLSPLESTYGKIYPLRAEQGAVLPYMVQFQVSNTPEATKDTTSIADHIRWQVSIFDDNYRDTQTIGDAVRNILDGYSGTIGTDEIAYIEFDNEVMLHEDDYRVFHLVQDYIITVKK